MVNGRGAVPSRNPEAAGRLPLGRRQQFSQRRERRDEDPGQNLRRAGDRPDRARNYLRDFYNLLDGWQIHRVVEDGIGPDRLLSGALGDPMYYELRGDP